MKKEKFKSVSINIDTYNVIALMAKKEDRSIASMIRQLAYGKLERASK